MRILTFLLLMDYVSRQSLLSKQSRPIHKKRGLEKTKPAKEKRKYFVDFILLKKEEVV